MGVEIQNTNVYPIRHAKFVKAAGYLFRRWLKAGGYHFYNCDVTFEGERGFQIREMAAVQHLRQKRKEITPEMLGGMANNLLDIVEQYIGSNDDLVRIEIRCADGVPIRFGLIRKAEGEVQQKLSLRSTHQQSA